jgi:O-antigen/teichoic acid export membrane protein
MNKRRVIVNVLAAGAWSVLDLGLLIWVQQHLVRRISPEEYSLLALVQSVTIPLSLLIAVLAPAMGRFVTESYALGRKDEVSRMTASMFPAMVIGAAVVLVMGALLVWGAPPVLGVSAQFVREFRLMLSLLVSQITIRVLLIPFSVGVFVVQRHYIYHAIELVCSIVKVLAILTLFYFAGTRVLWLVLAQAGTNLLAGLTVAGYSIVLLPALLPSGKPSLALIMKNLRFGGWVLVDRLGRVLFSAMDPLILARFASPLQVGTFHLGNLPARRLEPFLALVVSPLQPIMVSFFALGQRERLEALYRRIGRYALWFLGVFACPLIVLREAAFGFYLADRAGDYAAAPTVMALTLLAGIPLYSLLALARLANAHARIREYNLAYLGCQIFNLALTWFLVARVRMGALGSAWASLVALWVFSFGVFLPMSHRLFGISLRGYARDTLARGLLPWLPALGVLYLLRPFAVGWITLAAVAGAGCAVFAVGVALCLRPEERKDVGRVWGRVVGGRRSEDGGRRSEDGCRKSEIGCRGSEGRKEDVYNAD